MLVHALDHAIVLLDEVKEYFGVRIGMYFAFLGEYTLFLTIPALIGVLIWLSSGSNQVCLMGVMLSCFSGKLFLSLLHLLLLHAGISLSLLSNLLHKHFYTSKLFYY